MTISFEICKELESIQEEVHRFAKKEIRPRLRDFEKEGDIPEGLRKRFSELGLTLIEYAEEYGGMETTSKEIIENRPLKQVLFPKSHVDEFFRLAE